MLFDDDLDPKTKKRRPRPLDPLSVPELREYMAALEEESRRVAAEIARKENYKSAADAFFSGKPKG